MALLPQRKGESLGPMTSLQREMNKLFDDFFGRDFGLEPFRSIGEWRPAVDLSETDDAVIVKAELPGLEVHDVDVSITGDVLTIKGEKKHEREEKTRNFTRIERSYGTFERSLALPAAVMAEKISADFKNGVLTVTMPKSEEAKRKTLKIDVK